MATGASIWRRFCRPDRTSRLQTRHRSRAEYDLSVAGLAGWLSTGRNDVHRSFGVDLHHQSVRTQAGTDEIGYEFTRYVAPFRGEIAVTGSGHFRMTAPDVMFRKVIHDGLAGDSFLRNFTTTYDLENERMIFSSPRDGSERISSDRWRPGSASRDSGLGV